MVLNDLKQNVIDLLNKSQLPIDAIYYVMREIMQEVDLTYNKILEEEKKQKEDGIKVEEVKETEADNKEKEE